MSLYVKLSTGTTLVVASKNIQKLHKQIATGASFIQIDAIDLEDWTIDEKPILYNLNTKHIVTFYELKFNE